MPVLLPADYWKRSGRYESVGAELFRLRDRRDAEMVLAMTEEEIVTSHVASAVRSWRDLPLILYHIQTKERDEPRPRAGVLRTREFIMKDSYTFDRDPEGLDVGYAKHIEAYDRIFDRAGLEWYRVESDVGMMGGSGAHEYMAPSAAGENEVALRRRATPPTSRWPRPSPSRWSCRAPLDAPDARGHAGPDHGRAGLRRAGRGARRAAEGLPDRARRQRRHAHGRRARRPPGQRGQAGQHAGRRLPPRAIRTRWPSASARPASSGRWTRGSPVLLDAAVDPDGTYVAGANEPDHHLVGVRPGRDFAFEVGDVRRRRGGRPRQRRADPARARHRGRQHLQARHPLLRAARAPPTSTSPARSSSSGWAATGSAPRASPPRRWSSTPTRPGSPGRARSRRGTSSLSAWARRARPSMSWPSGSTTSSRAAGLEVLYDDRDAGPGEKFTDAELPGLPACG